MSKTDKELLKLELIRQFDNKLAFSDWMRVYHPVRFLNPSVYNPNHYLESRKFIHTELGLGIKVNTLRTPLKFEIAFVDLNSETEKDYQYCLDISNETELLEEYHWIEECYIGRSRLSYTLKKSYLSYSSANNFREMVDDDLRYIEINSNGVLDMNVDLESFLSEIKSLKESRNRVYLTLEINMDDVYALDIIEWTEKVDKAKLRQFKEALIDVAKSEDELHQFEDIVRKMVYIFKVD